MPDNSTSPTRLTASATVVRHPDRRCDERGDRDRPVVGFREAGERTPALRTPYPYLGNIRTVQGVGGRLRLSPTRHTLTPPWASLLPANQPPEGDTSVAAGPWDEGSF